MSEESFENSRPFSAPAVSRTLPHSIEAEQLLLSSCFLDGADVLTRCAMAGIRPESFYDSRHAVIFDTMQTLYAKQRPIELSVVAEELKTTKQLDSVGGYPTLMEVSQKVPTTAQAGYFIEKVRELAALRDIIRAATSAVEECYNFSGGIEEFAANVNTRIAKATGQLAVESEEPIQSVARKLLTEVLTPKESREAPIPSVSWGLVDIDKGCGRLEASSLVILAGPPSSGKSALADQVAWQAASGGANVLIFTYEMSKREKAIRMAQQGSHLNFDEFDDAPMDLKTAFLRTVREISECKTLHVFERDVTVNRLVSRTQAFAQKQKVGLVVVDFLQYLARLEPTIGRERTDEKIGRLTAAAKKVARDCQCPVLLLSSMNRDSYREGKPPTIASLKGSGEIESDADVIAFLHWPDETPAGNKQNPHDSTQRTFYVEFLQEKGRSKGVHKCGLRFDRKATSFENYIP